MIGKRSAVAHPLKIAIVLISLITLSGDAWAAHKEEKAVLAAHEQRRIATLAGDASALDRMMTDDLTFMHPNAHVETKTEFLDAVRTRRYLYKSLTDEERQIRVHGNTGIVSGICRIVVHVGGQDVDVRVAFTELWVKKGKSWKMALWQATQVSAAASLQ